MWTAFIIIILFFLAQVLGGIFAYSYANINMLCGEIPFNLARLIPPSSIEIGIGTLVAETILIVVLWMCHLTGPTPLRCYRKGMPRKWLLAIMGFVVLAFGINFLLTPLNLEDFDQTANFAEMKESWLCLILLCFVGPMAEEFTFREGILRSLKKNGLNPWIAIFTSAFAFGIIHVDPMQVIPAIALGIALGVLYHKTGDLRLCLIAHILNNTLAVLELEIPKIDDFLNMMSENYLFVLITGGLLFIAGGTMMIYNYYKK